MPSGIFPGVPWRTRCSEPWARPGRPEGGVTAMTSGPPEWPGVGSQLPDGGEVGVGVAPVSPLPAGLLPDRSPVINRAARWRVT